MKITKPAIVMVHGAFAGGWAFNKFKSYFEAKGYVCIAPDLRHHTRSPQRVSGHDLGRASLLDYAQDLQELIETLDCPPILMGHSMGGLLCQMLSARGLGGRLILLAPSPPAGIVPSSTMEQMTAVGIFASGMGWGQVIAPDYETTATHALSHMPKHQQKAFFEKLGNESGTALFEIMCWMLDMRAASRVDAHKTKAPVLLLAGGNDPINSPGTVRQIAKRYGDRATYHCLARVSHWLIDGPHWRTAADYCAAWLEGSDTAPQNAQGEKHSEPAVRQQSTSEA